MGRLPVKRLSKVQFFCGITTLQIWPYLGTSKYWGHSVLQTPALVLSNSKYLSSLTVEVDCCSKVNFKGTFDGGSWDLKEEVWTWAHCWTLYFQLTAKENKAVSEDKAKLTEHFIQTLPQLLLKVRSAEKQIRWVFFYGEIWKIIPKISNTHLFLHTRHGYTTSTFNMVDVNV